MSIKKVAVAGGTGNLGPAVVNALVEANLEVTVLSRTSSHNFDPRVKVQVVDYSSEESLKAVLSGQDAVINTLNVGFVPRDVHLRLVDAAHAAGVQRFVPSEFGTDTSNPLTSKLPVFGDKIAVIERLREISEKDKAFTWTALITGPFFDWGLEKGFSVNLKGPSTLIFDGGDVLVSTTTLGGIGRAVAGLLAHPEETKNRHVYVSEADVTQNQLLEWSGNADKIERQPVKTEDLETQAYEAVKQSPPDFGTFASNLIRRAVYGGEKYNSFFAKPDNEVLGVPKWTEAQIKELVKKNA
ncbi:oxidoreductase CipA [Penicillium taxi]|uniref:oxidoreductase CipA n=1 Tax=Penicillium taxi TaxID=168475 RepID=UPI0025454AC9|nr:oxidoreductase CipA [Penicillium taxi]KAJ5894877.1 oxidoreductase CipA [Penicillium taxi]